MKYLLNGNDIAGADYGRVIYNENKILLKGFPDMNGHAYVDLGLPSGTLWATCNVGANKPEDVGLYFQWGDTQGYTAEQVGTDEGKKQFSQWGIDYKYSDGGGNNDTYYNLTKYCNKTQYGKDGFTDTLVTLELKDDAVRANMGGDWRMPLYEELMELILNTNLYLVLSDGTEIEGAPDDEYFIEGLMKWQWNPESLGSRKTIGVKYINKNDSSKYILVPFSGCAINGSIAFNGINERNGIWTSSITENNCNDAWTMHFNRAYDQCAGVRRWSGLPVRGVIKK